MSKAERTYIIAGDVVAESLDDTPKTVESVNVVDQTAKVVFWDEDHYAREVIELKKLIIVA